MKEEQTPNLYVMSLVSIQERIIQEVEKVFAKGKHLVFIDEELPGIVVDEIKKVDWKNIRLTKLDMDLFETNPHLYDLYVAGLMLQLEAIKDIKVSIFLSKVKKSMYFQVSPIGYDL